MKAVYTFNNVYLPLDINSWNDFKNHLEGKSTLEKGTAFEELTKLYLEYHPVYRTKLKTVWLQKEIPTTVSESAQQRSRH